MALTQLIKSITASKNTFEAMVTNKPSYVLQPTVHCSSQKNIETQMRFYSTKKRKKTSNSRLTKPTIEEKSNIADTPSWLKLKDEVNKHDVPKAGN